MRYRVTALICTFLICAAAHAADAVVVDPNTVGTWELRLKGGPWVWEIHSDGTYSFHSEAGDGVPPHSGTFSARNGLWSLKATTGYTDQGTYLVQPPDTLIARGRLGIGAWRRPAPKSDSSDPGLHL